METQAAINVLKSGELAILPTETVYGLFADATNEAAVKKLYAVKGRPTEKALNMNVSSLETILKYSKKSTSLFRNISESFLAWTPNNHFRGFRKCSRMDSYWQINSRFSDAIHPGYPRSNPRLICPCWTIS